MLRILTWNAETGFEKMPSKDVPAFNTDRHSNVVPCASVPAKRKCSFDASIPSPNERHAVKALPVTDVTLQSEAKLNKPSPSALQTSNVVASSAPVQHPEMARAESVKPVAVPTPVSAEKVKCREEAQLATMRQTISSQLSLEILLKHRELRLIDQEIAKCQVALEQLRRCTEIPFPATRLPCEQVSSGKGAAIRKTQEKRSARSPAPWGVTDGPYTRHYAKWLIQDPHFDGGESDPALSMAMSNIPFSGRTRGHITDFAQLAGKTSRSQRALNHSFLPNGFAEPKVKPTGPMILKRKSDGKMVKLVCPDCGRHDFGSAQGFINHCRIGHQRNYASHDAAAEGCGQPLEADETNLVKEPAVESQPQTPITVPPTPVAISATIGAGVQPLVLKAHTFPKDNAAQPLLRGGYVPRSQRKPKKSKKASASQPQCSAAPNLSTFMQDRGVDVDLQQLVTEVKSKDLPEAYLDDEDIMECDSPVLPHGGNSRHPSTAGHKRPMKTSGKSLMSHTRREDGSFSSLNTAQSDSQMHGLMSLLPSPTNESTQAPSLIDDDEEMDPQSPPSSDEIDEADVHFHIRDDDHPEEGHELRGPEMQAPSAPCTVDPRSVQPTLPAPAPLPRPMTAKAETQVQFIVEHPDRDMQSDRKRRRIGN